MSLFPCAQINDVIGMTENANKSETSRITDLVLLELITGDLALESIPTSTLVSLLIILIAISAYFSGSETAFLSLNRYKLRHRAKQGSSAAKRVERLLKRPEQFITLILIGNNLVNILASAIATILGMRFFGDLGVAIATGSLTLVILICAEITPKTIASHYPAPISFASSWLFAVFNETDVSLGLATQSAHLGVLRLFHLKPEHQPDRLNTEELRTIVNDRGNVIPRRYQDMLLSVLELGEMKVNDIMVPKTDIFGININEDWKNILRQLTQLPMREWCFIVTMSMKWWECYAYGKPFA